MQMKLIEGISPLPDHEEINAALEAECDPWGPSGKPMDIAIMSPDGPLYWAIRAEGLGEYRAFTSILEKRFSLTNTGETLTVQGVVFDDVFRRLA